MNASPYEVRSYKSRMKRSPSRSDRQEREWDLIAKLRGVKALPIKAKQPWEPPLYEDGDDDDPMQIRRRENVENWHIIDDR